MIIRRIIALSACLFGLVTCSKDPAVVSVTLNPSQEVKDIQDQIRFFFFYIQPLDTQLPEDDSLFVPDDCFQGLTETPDDPSDDCFDDNLFPACLIDFDTTKVPTFSFDIRHQDIPADERMTVSACGVSINGEILAEGALLITNTAGGGSNDILIDFLADPSAATICQLPEPCP